MYYQQLSILWTRIKELYWEVIKNRNSSNPQSPPNIVSSCQCGASPDPSLAFQKTTTHHSSRSRPGLGSFLETALCRCTLCAPLAAASALCLNALLPGRCLYPALCPDGSWRITESIVGHCWWQYETNFMLTVSLKIERSEREREPVRPVNSVARR